MQRGDAVNHYSKYFYIQKGHEGNGIVAEVRNESGEVEARVVRRELFQLLIWA